MSYGHSKTGEGGIAHKFSALEHMIERELDEEPMADNNTQAVEEHENLAPSVAELEKKFAPEVVTFQQLLDRLKRIDPSKIQYDQRGALVVKLATDADTRAKDWIRKITGFWEPLVTAQRAALNALLERRKSMLDAAERIRDLCFPITSAYEGARVREEERQRREAERIQREETERARQEHERLLAEQAAAAKSAGDELEAARLTQEAEDVRQQPLIPSAPPPNPALKGVEGFSFRTVYNRTIKPAKLSEFARWLATQPLTLRKTEDNVVVVNCGTIKITFDFVGAKSDNVVIPGVDIQQTQVPYNRRK